MPATTAAEFLAVIGPLYQFAEAMEKLHQRGVVKVIVILDDGREQPYLMPEFKPGRAPPLAPSAPQITEKPSGSTEEEPLTEPQDRIMECLEYRGLKSGPLERETDLVGNLHKMDALKGLQVRGKVRKTKDGVYYRLDAPPPELERRKEK